MLKCALTRLYNCKIENQYYRPVRTYILNPKSVTLGELYGEVNPCTLEWKDGLLGKMMKAAVKVGIKWTQVLCNKTIRDWCFTFHCQLKQLMLSELERGLTYGPPPKLYHFIGNYAYKIA